MEVSYEWAGYPGVPQSMGDPPIIEDLSLNIP